MMGRQHGGLINPSRLRKNVIAKLRACCDMEAAAQTASNGYSRRAPFQSELLTSLIRTHHATLRRRLKRLKREHPEHSALLDNALMASTPQPKAPTNPVGIPDDDDFWKPMGPADFRALEAEAGYGHDDTVD